MSPINHLEHPTHVISLRWAGHEVLATFQVRDKGASIRRRPLFIGELTVQRSPLKKMLLGAGF